MDPETRDPGTYHSPSRGPTEPRGPGPSKQPPGVPFPPGVETGRPPQHLNMLWASPGSCLNLSDPGPDPEIPPHPDPSPQPSPSSSGEGAMYKRGVHMVQTSPPTRAATE
ncbi:hypothetical protein CRENBAI_023777 [Crenichthys baileyi]|uniref:Uncharacterized protein n=1 Tax=Crenichthys baileyi TaxID=28760 RepID=A0AAV9QSD5_9TELE